MILQHILHLQLKKEPIKEEGWRRYIHRNIPDKSRGGREREREITREGYWKEHKKYRMRETKWRQQGLGAKVEGIQGERSRSWGKQGRMRQNRWKDRSKGQERRRKYKPHFTTTLVATSHESMSSRYPCLPGSTPALSDEHKGSKYGKNVASLSKCWWNLGRWEMKEAKGIVIII